MDFLAGIQNQCDRLIHSRSFEYWLIGVLITDAIILIVEAFTSYAERLIITLLNIILGVLILDSILRLGAKICQLKDYFHNIWNCFDLLILAGLLQGYFILEGKEVW